MASFKDTFLNTVDEWPTGELFTDREETTREKAIQLFVDYIFDMYFGVETPLCPEATLKEYVLNKYRADPSCLEEHWVRYQGGYSDDYEWYNGWWLYQNGKKGAKKVWMWDGSHWDEWLNEQELEMTASRDVEYP